MDAIRIRLRRSSVSPEYPFTNSYLVPAAEQEHYYRWFGPCISVPFGTFLRDSLKFIPVEHGSKQEILDDNVVRRVVVPVKLSRRYLDIPTWQSERVQRLLRKKHVDGQRETLQQVYPPTDTLVHLSKTHPMCTLCPQQLMALAGMCTPGEQQCPQNIKLPRDTFSNYSGRPSSPSYYDERLTLPTVR